MNKTLRFLACTLLCIAAVSNGAVRGESADNTVLMPYVDGPWWQVAGDPDLGEYTTRQQPVDFAVWQATDGTWQLWSCIRGTR